MERPKRKRIFGHMRTSKAQISLRIRAVWSKFSLSANRIIRYHRMYQWRAKARMGPCACAGWCESANVVHAQRHVFAWCYPHVVASFYFTKTVVWVYHAYYVCEAKIQSVYHLRLSFSRLPEIFLIMCIIIADKVLQILEYISFIYIMWNIFFVVRYRSKHIERLYPKY